MVYRWPKSGPSRVFHAGLGQTSSRRESTPAVCLEDNGLGLKLGIGLDFGVWGFRQKPDPVLTIPMLDTVGHKLSPRCGARCGQLAGASSYCNLANIRDHCNFWDPYESRKHFNQGELRASALRYRVFREMESPIWASSQFPSSASRVQGSCGLSVALVTCWLHMPSVVRLPHVIYIYAYFLFMYLCIFEFDYYSKFWWSCIKNYKGYNDSLH